MTNYNYKIEAYWPGRVESPADIGRKFLRTLEVFDSIDPLFGEWGTADDKIKMTSQPVGPLRPNFTAFVEANVKRDDYGDPDPDSGYRLWAASHARTDALMTPSTMVFLVSAGSNWRNDFSLSAGSNYVPPDPKIVTYPIFKSALLAMLAIWPAPSADAHCFQWGHKAPTGPGEPPFPWNEYEMPWLAYLDADRARDLILPHDIPTERTPDGGLLMIAAETRFDPANRDHMRRSRVLAQIMSERAWVPRVGY